MGVEIREGINKIMEGNVECGQVHGGYHVLSLDWGPSSYVESYTSCWGSCGTWCTHNCGSLAIFD